ncbi:hypothetical protein AB0I60_16245 [Actinosynnema sp. NPDC050436]|uniref:hypothetical protein n=1 Tax=Actinosynnema sp. NPDC050436 TaxID=3155659 RepID=UPI0033D5ED3F
MARKTLPPGTPAPSSGQYKVPGSKTEITAIAGKPLPPTPSKGQGYVQVDRTKHKNG